MKRLLIIGIVGCLGACGEGLEPTEASDLVGIGAAASALGSVQNEQIATIDDNNDQNNVVFFNNEVTTCFSTGLHRINGAVFIYNGNGECSSVTRGSEATLGIGNTGDDSRLEVSFDVNDRDLPNVPARISLRTPESQIFLGNNASCSLSNLRITLSLFSAAISCDSDLVAGNGDTMELQEGFSFETSTFPSDLGG